MDEDCINGDESEFMRGYRFGLDAGHQNASKATYNAAIEAAAKAVKGALAAKADWAESKIAGSGVPESPAAQVWATTSNAFDDAAETADDAIRALLQ